MKLDGGIPGRHGKDVFWYCSLLEIINYVINNFDFLFFKIY